MSWQTNKFQIKEKDKTAVQYLGEVEVNSLPNKEFKIMTVRVFKELRRLHEQREKLEVLTKSKKIKPIFHL